MLDILPVMGEYRYNMDGKNRVFIPSKHREALGSPLIIYPSIRDRALKVCSLLMRFFNRMGDTFVPDSQGRVTLNADLVAYAGLSGTVVIIGCGQNAEIWSSEEYEKLGSSPSFDAEVLRAAAENADV